MNDAATVPPEIAAAPAAEITFDLAYLEAAFREVRAVVATRATLLSRVATTVAVVAVAGAWIFGPSPTAAKIDGDLRIAATIILAVLFLAPPLVRRGALKRAWRAEAQRGARVRFEFKDEGLRVVAPGSDASIPWDEVVLAARRPTGLVVMLRSDGKGLWIPDAAFAASDGPRQAGDVAKSRVADFRGA